MRKKSRQIQGPLRAHPTKERRRDRKSKIQAPCHGPARKRFLDCRTPASTTSCGNTQSSSAFSNLLLYHVLPVYSTKFPGRNERPHPAKSRSRPPPSTLGHFDWNCAPSPLQLVYRWANAFGFLVGLVQEVLHLLLAQDAELAVLTHHSHLGTKCRQGEGRVMIKSGENNKATTANVTDRTRRRIGGKHRNVHTRTHGKHITRHAWGCVTARAKNKPLFTILCSG